MMSIPNILVGSSIFLVVSGIVFKIIRSRMEQKYTDYKETIRVDGKTDWSDGGVVVITTNRCVILSLKVTEEHPLFHAVPELLFRVFDIPTSWKKVAGYVLESKLTKFPSPLGVGKSVSIGYHQISIPTEYEHLRLFKRAKMLRRYMKFHNGLHKLILEDYYSERNLPPETTRSHDVLIRKATSFLQPNINHKDKTIHEHLLNLSKACTNVFNSGLDYRKNNNVRQTLGIHLDKLVEMVRIYGAMDATHIEKERVSTDILDTIIKMTDVLDMYLYEQTQTDAETVSRMALGIAEMLDDKKLS